MYTCVLVSTHTRYVGCYIEKARRAVCVESM